MAGTLNPNASPIAAKHSGVSVSIPFKIEFPTTTIAALPGFNTRFISFITRDISE